MWAIITAMKITPMVACTYWASCMPLMSAAENGKSMMMPVTLMAMPKSATIQKMIFWSVVLGGIALSVTGIIMLFPFSLAGISGMQWAQYIHAIVGVILIAVMIAHIYIGSLGMEGAYDAMGSGEVDLTWARRHHRAWVEEQQAKTASGPQTGGRAPAPAE